MKRTAIILLVALSLMTAGCADSAVDMIQDARTEQELTENALELEELPEEEAAVPEAEATPGSEAPTQTNTADEPVSVPFLDKDGGGDFNATPRELVYSFNLLMPETPFEGEEQLKYSSYRYSNEKGLLLCMQVNNTTTHPNAIVIAGAAYDPETVKEVQRLSALLFRMVNENTTAQQGKAYLEAMGATGPDALPAEPVVKYSETMTYEVGVYNGVYYMTVSAQPAKAITVSYETMFTMNEPEPEPETTPEPDDGSLASASLGSMDVKVLNVKGGLTKNGTKYIGLTLSVKNNGVVGASLASSCYVTVTQNDVEMEELTFVTQETNAQTPISAGDTKEFDVFYKCVSDEYTGITLRIKALMGDPDSQILISF